MVLYILLVIAILIPYWVLFCTNQENVKESEQEMNETIATQNSTKHGLNMRKHKSPPHYKYKKLHIIVKNKKIFKPKSKSLPPTPLAPTTRNRIKT